MFTGFVRTVILYVILMVGLRLMGKRQIGELEPSELVLTLIISDLASVPMQDFGIPLLNGLVPIITILCLSMLISFLSLRSLRFRGLLCGHPAVLIRDGVIDQQVMTKNRITVDELFEQLRSQGCSDLSTVKYAVLETSGQLSLLPYAKDSPLTAKTAGVKVKDDTRLPTLIISDGRLLSHNLAGLGLSRTWLDRELKKRSLSTPGQVFFLTVDERGGVVCVAKEAKA